MLSMNTDPVQQGYPIRQEAVMILSKKSRYGLRSLVDLAAHSDTEHMALSTIAQRNGISPQYLEQVFTALRRADIVRSIKGPQGGYFLGRPAENITISEIILALDGSYYVEDETENQDARVPFITQTLQALVIDPVNAHLDEVLCHVTLADLLDFYQKNSQEAQDMYYI